MLLLGLAACATPHGAGTDDPPDASPTEIDAAAVTADAAPPAPLRVMTYNIQRGGVLGTQLDAVAAVITAHAPDVVALDEVDYLQPGSGFIDEARSLAEKTGMTDYYFGCTVGCASSLPGRYGIALLSKVPLSNRTKDFLPNTTSGAIDLSGAIEPRVLLCGTLAPPGTAALRFCVTHLTNDSATPDAQTIRLHQAAALLAHLGSTAATDRVILAGDLNESPGHDAINLLRATFADAWATAGSGGGPTIPSDVPAVRFDYVLYGSGLGPAVSAEVPVTTASDHRPVVVELR